MGRRGPAEPFVPVLLGAVVPDLPMVLLYLVERGLLGAPEAVVWQERYFSEGWQLFVDAFNSLPLIVLGLLVAWRANARSWQLFFLSAGLHTVCDLLVHHDDAHRHFLPFSEWRFASPVSYWDPAYHGLAFAGFEALLVVGGAVWLWRRDPRRGVRWIAAATLALYLGFAAFALAVWGPLGAG